MDEITILRNKNIEIESKHLALLDVYQQLLVKFELDAEKIKKNISLSKQTLRVGYLIKEMKNRYNELETNYKSMKKKEREYFHRKQALSSALKKNDLLKDALLKKDNTLTQQSILLTSCEEKLNIATVKSENTVKENSVNTYVYKIII